MYQGLLSVCRETRTFPIKFELQAAAPAASTVASCGFSRAAVLVG
ncbi:hypothetical protein PCCS19_00830 [Paenibacillus sp. CCS19]|nr:hypothetical protein PCCS19_00830 [Paenibacillus cellulosilyticus]